MEHLDVQLVHRLIRGQMDAATRARWAHHLRGCARCRDLVADERALMNVLNLDGGIAPAGSPTFENVLDQVPGLGAPTTSARRTRLLTSIAGLVAVLALAGLFAWQLRALPPGPAALAEELRIPADLQDKVVANLGALDTLQREPWLVEQYEAVHTLEQLIADKEP